MKKTLMIFLAIFILAIVGLFTKQYTAPPLGENLWLTTYTILGVDFLLVNILTGFIVFFISVIVVILFFILLNRVKMEKRQKIKDILIPSYQKLIISFLSHEYPEEKDYFNHIKKLGTTDFKKQILIDEILDIAKNLKEGKLKKLQYLYFSLKLQKETYKKIRYGQWYNKIKGIKELCALNIVEKKDLIIKYAHSHNEFLRMEAQTALVDLSRFDENPEPFKFLDELSIPFSTWEQISLYQVMLDREITPPNFNQWMYSDNHTVILFCLRMMREYNQTENADLIKDLVWHDNEDVRFLTYQVLGDLKLAPQLKEVRKLYKDETVSNKREMIKSIRKVADPRFFNFLKKIIDNEEDAETLVEAVRAINETNGGKEILNKMLTDTYKNYNIIIKHIKDRNIY